MEEELITGLPQEIAWECLLRMHYTCHPSARRVCRRWAEAVGGRELFLERKRRGATCVLACLVQSQSTPAQIQKQTGPPVYAITVLDPDRAEWTRLPPVPKYPAGLPFFCRVAGVDGRLVVLGGWDPATWAPVRDVFVYDFAEGCWLSGRSMPDCRSFFAVGAVGRRVFVAGGHDEGKNALRTAAVYDVGRDEWALLGPMEEERDECRGAVVDGEFRAVGGYATDAQGRFKDSSEVYDEETGRWRRVNGAWSGSDEDRRSDRVLREAGVGLEGSVVVGLEGRKLIVGSAQQGGPQGFLLVDDESGKLRKVEAPEDFSGFVQTGCCVEI